MSGGCSACNAGELRLDDRSIGVRVRAPDSFRFEASILEVLPILDPATRRDHASARSRPSRPPSRAPELLRENQQQMIALTADVRRSLGR